MISGLRTLVAASTVAAVTATAIVTPASAGEAGEVGETPRASRVAVSVATLWVSPESPRAADAHAVRTPAKPVRWLRGLSTSGRRGLHGRVESQALYGQPVQVLAERGSWSRVVLPTQPSPKSPDGYPGWIPTAQLVPDTSVGAATTQQEAVVKRRRTWTFEKRDRSVRALNLSYGTRLPVLRDAGRMVKVVGPEGRVQWVSGKRVKVVADGEPARKPTRRGIVKEARKFLGLPYLWGGTSGFGFDCSGLTHAVYAQVGITIPRDATPQYEQGTRIRSRSDLRRGDLVFFRDSSGSLHHVGIYAGSGRMIHSPRTGQDVQYASITSGLWAREFAGGRRYF